MKIPREIIDNSENNTLVDFLNDTLEDIPSTNLDIATAFFNLRAYELLRENLDSVTRFRLLLGTPPEFSNDNTLGDVLLREIRLEIEELPLSREANETIAQCIVFLQKDHVEIRLSDAFLHGKTYIFDDRIVIGSSNFTGAGLTRFGELNTWKQEAQAVYTREKWFEKYWDQANDFKSKLIALLEQSRFGNNEYSPYQIFIKSLYELQKEEILNLEKIREIGGLPETKVNLSEFQDDAVARALTRLKKYNACIIADSVGLGKTWIAKKIIESVGYYQRKNILVICPAQLRLMWEKELKGIDVSQNVISQEELGSDDFLEKVTCAICGRFKDLELIVVDESHNFRNPLSKRWENFFTLINDNIVSLGKRPKMLFLTATPINNTPWDLYWQLMILTLMDQTMFIKENIPDLQKLFKQAENHPEVLSDLLNEISIRRTRDYIINNYPDAYIKVETGGNEIFEKKITFPKRTLENIEYNLDSAYHGMYKEISETISSKLSMAYYRLLEYKLNGSLTEAEQLELGRMIAIGGIFRTILLKRLESSVNAFRLSVTKQILFLENLKTYLNDGWLLSKKTFNKYLLLADEELEPEDIHDELIDFDKSKYRFEELVNDIDQDIELLTRILGKVATITPGKDAKLNVLKENLLNLSRSGQIVVFTYYADTLEYIAKEIKRDPKFSCLSIEAVSSSGSTGKTPAQRAQIIEDFTQKRIDIVLSTDVLSEGQNLQSAQYLINYDLHWNPTRMIQRAGRIDRIGSQFDEIFIFNFFPEDELEELLRLVKILQDKIIGFDTSIGLDQSVLGEEIHPKVFGAIKRFKEKDETILGELENDAFGGGEKFYQPLKDFLRKNAIAELEKIPYGVYSGLRKGAISGIFFYYKYEDDFNFWYVYDFQSENLISNRSEIIDFITCSANEKRIISDDFEKIYEINRIIVNRITADYQEIYGRKTQDTQLKVFDKSGATKFIRDMLHEIEYQIDEYMDDYPDDSSILELWEPIRAKLLKIAPTKKRQQILRKLWGDHKQNRDWKSLIERLGEFCIDKRTLQNESMEEFDIEKLRLVTVDFIS